MSQKNHLREHFKKVLRQLPDIRRDEARGALWDYLEGHLERCSKVLSFASMKYEVDLSLVNQVLLNQGKLHLPRVEEGQLIGYRVTDLEREMHLGKHKILEPRPELCRKEEEFDCILVPAVVFDERNYRIGYGFGYYDRLLSRYKGTASIGVGFREQLSLTPLPIEEHDEPVKELCLV